MQEKIKITFLMGCFNEESRIGDMLEHAVQWADEVLILDKGSTDNTRSICSRFGPKVRFVEVPFSPQGHGDVVAAARIANNDWIWFGTCSEIPTKKLVTEAKEIIYNNPDLELVYIPRKIYSFGCDIPDSPWGIGKYPFLVNRSRVVITNTIHNNFHPRNHSKTAEVTYSETCCVHHFTHATAKGYLSAMAQYFEAESERPEQAEIIENALKNLSGRKDLESLLGTDSFGLECAWRSYWLGVALHGWEKIRNVNVIERYAEQRKQLLRKEWPSNWVPSASEFSELLSEPQSHSCPGLEDAFSRSTNSKLNGFAEDFLLHELRGRPIARMVQTLFQVGAHRFQEKKLLFEIFPNLKEVVLFEPLPHLYDALVTNESSDPRIKIFPYAISNQNGTTTFHVSNNDGASSSLLPFGQHKQLFPHVNNSCEIAVQTRTLGSVIEEHGLTFPDFLFLDVQGAEFQILSSLYKTDLERLKMIYTEASTSEIYIGGRTLDQIKKMLSPEMSFVGYCPLSEDVLSHGNALFASKSHSWLLMPTEPPRTVESLGAGTVTKGFGDMCRKLLSKKMLRSLRKRLRSMERALGGEN
jgi:FkbM family methyltransferase